MLLFFVFFKFYLFRKKSLLILTYTIVTVSIRRCCYMLYTMMHYVENWQRYCLFSNILDATDKNHYIIVVTCISIYFRKLSYRNNSYTVTTASKHRCFYIYHMTHQIENWWRYCIFSNILHNNRDIADLHKTVSLSKIRFRWRLF